MSNTNTAEVLVSRMPEAMERLAKVNRRASKLGVPAIDVKVVSTYGRQEARFPSGHPLHNPMDKVTRNVNVLEYTTAPVVVEGYEPIATLTFQHASPVVYEWPGKEVPASFRDTDRRCNHCETNRMRKQVFVLRHIETDDHIQVGSTCVRDFIGHTADTILQQWKLMQAVLVEDDADARIDFGWARKGDNIYDMASILPITCAVVREHGYVSVKMAEERDILTTRMRVVDQINPLTDMRGRRIRPLIAVTDTDIRQADAILAKVKAIASPANTYQHNIRAIARDGFCTNKELGIAVSMATFTFKREKPVANSGHIGELGERVTLTCKLKFTRPLANEWGTTYLTKWQTDDGNVVTWFASNYPALHACGNYSDVGIGDTVALTGTVKKHGDFQGQKETQVTRCRVGMAK